MIGVRPEQSGDEAVVREVVAAAFGDDVVPRLLDAMRSCPAWLDLSFVAEQDGDVIGHVSFTRGWLDTRERLVEVLVLSPMSVAPDLQGTGVGTRLVEESLALLGGRAEPLVFLEGSPHYYPRFGFVPGEAFGFRAPSERIPPAAFQVLTLPSYEPWMTGTLVYPDVFWVHDCVGLR